MYNPYNPNNSPIPPIPFHQPTLGAYGLTHNDFPVQSWQHRGYGAGEETSSWQHDWMIQAIDMDIQQFTDYVNSRRDPQTFSEILRSKFLKPEQFQALAQAIFTHSQQYPLWKDQLYTRLSADGVPPSVFAQLEQAMQSPVATVTMASPVKTLDPNGLTKAEQLELLSWRDSLTTITEMFALATNNDLKDAGLMFGRATQGSLYKKSAEARQIVQTLSALYNQELERRGLIPTAKGARNGQNIHAASQTVSEPVGVKSIYNTGKNKVGIEENGVAVSSGFDPFEAKAEYTKEFQQRKQIRERKQMDFDRKQKAKQQRILIGLGLGAVYFLFFRK